MNKRFWAVIALLLVSGMAFGSDASTSKQVYSFGLINSGASRMITIIPTTSIRPGTDKIIGYSIMPAKAGASELYVAIFDQTTNWLSGEVFAENEVLTPYGAGELWPYGKKIVQGVVVSQGANTQIQVYFISE
jgi:hypothetical protein